MQTIPVRQAQLAIQQGKLALQQGLHKANIDEFRRIKNQLATTQTYLKTEALKVSASEKGQLMQLDATLKDLIVQLENTCHESNLQQG